MKKTLFILLISVLLLGLAPHVSAAENEAGSAGMLTLGRLNEVGGDTRVMRLRAFLKSYDSPLADHANVFVAQADKYNLDWKLVAAIAGVESTFGKAIPPNSYNGWGWGIPTGAQDGIRFTDWPNGIAIVSRGLRENYMDKGARTVDQIGPIYAASPAWSWKVHFFIEKIQDFTPSDPESLSVTI